MNNRGTAALEFALLLPALLAISFGIIDLGRAIYTQTALDYAVQVLARCHALDATASCRIALLPGLEEVVLTASPQNECLLERGTVTFTPLTPLLPVSRLTSQMCYPT